MNAKTTIKRGTAQTPAKFRRTALSAACLLVLSAAAQAQGTAYNSTYAASGSPATPTSQTLYLGGYTLSLSENQTGTGAITGTITNGGQNSTLTGSAGSATPVTFTGYSADAIGSGNQSTNMILGLGGLANTTGGEGAAALTGQFMSGTDTVGVATKATISGTQVTASQTGMGSAPITLDGNSLRATTTLNRADTIASGSTPSTYTSTRTGSVSLTQTAAGGIDSGTTSPAAAGTTATINLGTYQSTFNASGIAASGSTVTNADIKATLTDTSVVATGTPPNVLASPISVSSNTVSADFKANTSTSQYQADSASGAFTGSVAITNAQSNVETLTPTGTPKTASVSGSVFSVDSATADATTSVTGAVTVASNRQTATSVGNSAGSLSSTGSVLAGNALIIDSGAAITSTGSSTGATVNAGTGATTLGADLLVANSQLNSGTLLKSSIDTGGATVRAETIGATGSVTLSSNTFQSAATGNLAGSMIYTNASTQTATAAASNLQVNASTPVTASTTDTVATVGIGEAGATANGTTTVGGNAILSSARGNLGSTTLTSQSTNLTAVASGDNANGVVATATSVTADAGMTASNVQSNSGATGNITATTTGAAVGASFTADGTLAGTGVAVSGAKVTVDGNTLGATAAGNTATTSAALFGTSATLQAAVGNAQSNTVGTVSATTSGDTTLKTGNASAASNLTVNGNATTADASGNTATNSLTAGYTNLTVGASPFVAATTSVTATGTDTQNRASLALANTQSNTSVITSSSSTANGFGAVLAGSLDTGSVTVGGNAATASTTANRATNTLRISDTNLDTPLDAAAQIAGLGNLQVNTATGAQTSTTGPDVGGSAPLFGLQFQTSMTATQATVSGNTAASSALGNVAGNTLAVTGTNLSSASPTGAGVSSGSASGSAGTVTNEFALANTQTDSVVGGRTATTRNIVVGVESTGALAATGVSGSTLTVSGNAVTAEARNNSASNALSLTGFATLDTGAGLANGQTSSTAVKAEVTSASVRIAGDGVTAAPANSAVSGSTFALTGNDIQSMAIGSSASNAMTIQGVALTGNATLSGSSAVGSTTATAVADFGVASRQQQTGTVTANTQGTQTIDLANVTADALSGAAVTNGSATLDGNSLRAIAQSLTVSNALVLSGTTVSATGAVVNAQNSTGAVSATQTTTYSSLGSPASFSVGAASTNGTAVSVSGNTILSSAGMNEAFNALTAAGTTVTGGTAVPSFSVLNNQAGGASVTSSALPGMLGVNAGSITGGSVTAAGNTVTAKSNVNYASNALTLDAASTLSGNGVVSSTQASTGASVSATIGDGTSATTAPINVGIAPPVPATGSTISGSVLTVSGNALNAQAGSNTVSNVLNAAAVSSIGAGTAPTFQVQNAQSNSSAVSTLVAYANIGAYGSGSGGSFGSTGVTVQGNQATATSYANTASNTIAMSTLPGSLNSASTSLGNSQSNTGAVSANVTGVSFGATASGGTGGGSVVISGNSTLAQATGNTSVNRIIGR